MFIVTHQGQNATQLAYVSIVSISCLDINSLGFLLLYVDDGAT